MIGGPAKAIADRRIRRTTDALVAALIDLVHAKRYDAITIQDLLDHADIGRSTFHSHYRFLRSLERAHMLERTCQAGATQLSHTIARRLAALPPERLPAGVPPAAMAQALAGALFALLRWWMGQEKPDPPERMDAMYHALWLKAPGTAP